MTKINSVEKLEKLLAEMPSLTRYARDLRAIVEQRYELNPEILGLCDVMAEITAEYNKGGTTPSKYQRAIDNLDLFVKELNKKLKRSDSFFWCALGRDIMGGVLPLTAKVKRWAEGVCIKTGDFVPYSSLNFNGTIHKSGVYHHLDEVGFPIVDYLINRVTNENGLIIRLDYKIPASEDLDFGCTSDGFDLGERTGFNVPQTTPIMPAKDLAQFFSKVDKIYENETEKQKFSYSAFREYRPKEKQFELLTAQTQKGFISASPRRTDKPSIAGTNKSKFPFSYIDLRVSSSDEKYIDSIFEDVMKIAHDKNNK